MLPFDGRPTDLKSDGASACAEARRTLAQMFAWVTLLLVLGLFMWAYYAYVLVFCRLLMDRNSVAMVSFFGTGFHILFFFCLWSYLQTTATSAPAIPRVYSLSVEEQIALACCHDDYKRRAVLDALATQRGVLTVGLDGCARHCEQCQLIKPDRCHHCSNCHRCVPKMDHHCPWFNNCVHFANYKFFLLTLIYLVLLSVFSVATTGTYVVLSWLGATDIPSSVHMKFLLVVGTVLAFAMGVFLWTHLSMVLSNQTTLEDMCGPIFRNPEDSFDIGRYENFVEVFGPRVWLWMLPVFTSIGDGVRFPSRLHPVPGSLERLSTFAALRTPAPDGPSLLNHPVLDPKPSAR
ncbi:palmitoyltransferase ZDHHC15A-like [Amblyomma americanum]